MTPFIDTPWKLDVREAQCLARLAEFSRREIAEELELSLFTINDCIASAFKKMKVHRSEYACVLFDRWWQAWQREHPDELARVNDLLQF